MFERLDSDSIWAVSFKAAPSSGHLRFLAGRSRSASCCETHLVLGDLPGRDVVAKLFQWVDDLAPWADRDHTVEDRVQMVDAGILEKENRGMLSVKRLKREGRAGRVIMR